MRMNSLNQNELEALRILWEEGELKPASIQNRFSWPIENATLRSVLVNLLEKGHITRKLRGKAFIYGACVKKATLLQNMLRTMARVFAGGSSRELVAQLVETGDIKPEDLELIFKTSTDNNKTKKKLI
jgi:BlaI family transcriptional regulator, penicillinase repressor